MAAQEYRPIDAGRNVVALPSAAGMPEITAILAAPGAGFSILHPREGNIHHFDVNGRLLRRFGRASDTTAKFERLYSHGWYGQMPWAQELNGNEIVVFDANTGRISTRIETPRMGPVQVKGIAPDGAPIVYTHFQQPRGTTPTFRYGYALLPAFGIRPKSPFAFTPEGGCGLKLGDNFVPIPWCQPTRSAVAPNGEWVAVVTSAPRSAAGNPTVRVVFLSVRGDTLSRTRIEAPRIAVPAAEVSSTLNAEVRSRRLNAGHAKQFHESVAPTPDHPMVTELFATIDRTVWLVQRTATATRYVLVNVAGREVARYSTAPDLQLMAAAGRTALGVRTAPSGAQQVVRVGF
jgi:hypothetical protein